MIDGEGERCAAEFHRIDAEQQVMHDGIADQRCLEDVLVRNARISRHVRRQSAQGFAHGCRHQGGAAGIHHRIRDAAHQILAEADLRIHDAGGGDDVAALKIAQMRGNGRRTHIDGETIDEFMQPRPDPDDLFFGVHRHGDLPRAGTQGRLQRLQRR